MTSLSRQSAPADVRLHFVVVDNEEQPNARPIVGPFKEKFNSPLTYAHEPRRGIPMARNRVLKEALRLNAGWIAYLDDDETAEPDWAEQLIAAARAYKADVVAGHVKRSYPAALPFWAIPAAKFAKRSEGGSIGRACTCNVLFAAWLVRPDGAGLQFNEALALSGGEDTDFFARAHRLGARMVFSKKAFVTEEIPSSKLTYASQVRTAYWHAASNVRVYKMRKGSLRTFGKFVPRIVTNYCAGLLQIALSARGADRQ